MFQKILDRRSKNNGGPNIPLQTSFSSLLNERVGIIVSLTTSMPYSVYVNTYGAERLILYTYFCYSGLTPGVKIGQYRVGPPWKPFLVLLILFIWFTLYSSCLFSRCSIVISIVIFHQYFSIKFSPVFL